MANPITERCEHELLGQVAPALPGEGDDRPSQHEPQVLREKADNNEGKPDERILRRRGCSRLPKQLVTRFYCRAFPIVTLDLSGRAISEIARHVPSYAFTVIAAISALVGHRNREREAEFPLAVYVHLV